MRVEQVISAGTWGGFRFDAQNGGEWPPLSSSAGMRGGNSTVGQWVFVAKGFVAKSNTTNINLHTWGDAQVVMSVDDISVVPDGDVIPSDYRIRIYWDGSPVAAVDVPLRNFFGYGYTDTRTWRSMALASDATGYVCWFPMPFAQSARIEVVNCGTVPGALSWEVRIEDSVPDMQQNGRFRARLTQDVKGTTATATMITMLDVPGKGIFLGQNCTMIGETDAISYLEGDEVIYVNGSTTPIHHGTGTEDFYNEGWYFASEGTFSLPYSGLLLNDENVAKYGRMAAYRLQLTDCIPFTNGFRLCMESGANNSTMGVDYLTTAYWYEFSSSGTPTDSMAPSTVNDLAISSRSSTSVTLRWTAPGDDGTVGTAAAYDLRRHTAMITEGNWASITPCIGVPAPQPAGTQQQYTQTGLNPGTSYYFALKTRDEVPNESALSNVLVVRTAEVQIDTTPPAAVMNLVASSPSLTSLRLTWTAPGARGTVGTAASYDIRYALNAITNLSQFAAATPCPGIPTPLPAGSQQTFIVQGLTAGTTYFFALRTTNADGYTSDLSNSPSGATLLSSDVTPPAQITTLAVTASSNTTVSLRWTAPGDDGTIGTATTYDIRYALGVITSTSFATATQCSGAPVPAAAGTQQTYTVTGLAPGGVRYYFALRTADESGNWSAISNVVTTATVNRPPAVNIAGPENGAVFPTGSGVIFTITAEDPDGSVQGIQLYRTTGTYTVMVGSSSGGSYNPNILFNDPGVFQMVARATDLNGAVGWSSTVTISITALPICGITSPTDQAVIYTTAPTATLTIVATATVASGAIERVEFYHGTTLLFTDSAAPYLYDWMNVPVGSYNLSVRAYANGQSANSLGVTVHVAALAPTCAITAPADHTTFATSTGATVVITAHADIPVGSIQRVEFYAGTTLLGVDSSSPYTFTWTAVMPGTYVLTARAFTASQSAVSAGVTIVVGAGGSSPGTVTVPPGDVRAFGGTEGYVRPDDGDVVRLFVNPRRTGTVSIRIHALTGALVREFTVQVAANVTAHQLWDCTDASGAIVPSGVYIVDVAGAGLKLRRKVAVVR
jgi:hypothetical protein